MGNDAVDEAQLVGARPASIISPVSVISRATASGTRCPMNVPPPAGKSPRCTSGSPNRADELGAVVEGHDR
jgi:hypothetical protein